MTCPSTLSNTCGESGIGSGISDMLFHCPQKVALSQWYPQFPHFNKWETSGPERWSHLFRVSSGTHQLRSVWLVHSHCDGLHQAASHHPLLPSQVITLSLHPKGSRGAGYWGSGLSPNTKHFIIFQWRIDSWSPSISYLRDWFSRKLINLERHLLRLS